MKHLGSHLTPEEAMSLAIDQASRGLGRVSPNPPVGACLLSPEGRCLALGYHKKYGDDHAEVMALKSISNPNQLKGSCLYVTLEPCSHQGLTPSCAKYLASLPLSKVCVGLQDPNPKVSGRGIEILKKASIEVEIYDGSLKPKLEDLIEVFSYNLQHRRPFVSVKIASSLNGIISIPNRKWLTGESARSHVALLRGHYDAVCIGVNTLIEDDPRLNSRHPDFLDQENTVIILDPKGKSFPLLEKSKLLKVRKPNKIIIITHNTIQKSPYKVLKCSLDKHGLFDLDEALSQLFEQGIHSILVEGGGMVFSSFLPIAQRIFLFLAPILAGASNNLTYWTSFQEGMLSLKHVQYSHFDEDILITGRICKY